MSELVTVDFHGSVLFAIEQDDEVFVALKPIVVGIGLDWDGQRQCVNRDGVLSEGAVMMPVPSASGGPQESLCLRLDLVNGWLFTIDDRRVKDPAVREKVLTYKRECYRVLFDHFYGQAATVVEQPKAASSLPSLEERRQWLLEIARVEKLFGDAAARDLWRRSPLPQPAETGNAGAAMFSDIDQFLAEATRRDAYGSINATALYKLYQKWCDGRQASPATQALFGREVRKRGIVAVRSGCVRYLGISLVTSAAGTIVGSAVEVLQ